MILNSMIIFNIESSNNTRAKVTFFAMSIRLLPNHWNTKCQRLCFPMLHCLNDNTQLRHTLCGGHALPWSPNLTLVRTVFLRNLIRTYVDNCQHAIFFCFSMLMRTVFKVYMLSSYSRYARLINLTTQSINRSAQSIDCTVNLILIKHCNLQSKIQGLLPTQGIILACLALS